MLGEGEVEEVQEYRNNIAASENVPRTLSILFYDNVGTVAEHNEYERPELEIQFGSFR